MYKTLIDNLKKADGYSQRVISLNIDVRGFTPFCNSVDSADVASFIKKIYLKILEDYFPEAIFAKPTGDGLFIIIPYSDKDLIEKGNLIIEKSIRLLENFENICKDDPLINFEVPKSIGIGISRGSVCCIKTEDIIIDYSGKILNLSNRLMDLARPKGIIFDSDFNKGVLKKEIKDMFKKEKVYIKGIAEKNPISIYILPSYTKISNYNKNPIIEEKWITKIDKLSIKDLTELKSKKYIIDLDVKPIDEKNITLQIKIITSEKLGDKFKMLQLIAPKNAYEVICIGNKYEVWHSIKGLLNEIQKYGFKDEDEVIFEIIYKI